MTQPPQKTYDQWERDLSGAQLACRDTSMHHAWTPFSAKATREGFTRILECARCEATKNQTLTKDGRVVKTSMTYPKGYLKPSGGTMPRRAVNARLRMMNLRNMTRKAQS